MAKGEFGRAPRHQKLVGLYGKQIHQLEPKTEFFNTIGWELPLDAEKKEEIEELEETGFQNWSTYDSPDLANGQLLSELYDELGLNKWPYR